MYKSLTVIILQVRYLVSFKQFALSLEVRTVVERMSVESSHWEIPFMQVNIQPLPVVVEIFYQFYWANMG